MKLIIAEKPSLAKNICNAIPESFQNRNGYFEGECYIVSWAFGHLFQLLDLDDYNSTASNCEKKAWTLNVLPFCPDMFRFKIKNDEGIIRQFGVLKTLMGRQDVKEIIHCGDADREGEVIIRLIINFGLKEKKAVNRLWLPEQTEESIRNHLRSVKPDTEYDNLYNEGLARTYADWLYGINLTRYASIKAGTLLRVGRVVTPIVKAIYDRYLEQKAFIPVKSWKVESRTLVDEIEIVLVSEYKFSLEQKQKAIHYCNQLNQADARVIEVEKKRVKRQPPKLFSLSKLQGVLGSRYKMSLADSMAAIQSLYESGYITYPRTNTEYLAENEKTKIDSVLHKLQSMDYPVMQKESKRIYDDTKIESHSALTPTTKIPANISGTAKTVYETVLRRFLAVFTSEECLVQETMISIQINEETFTLKGTIIEQKGFMKYEPIGKEKVVPNLREGDKLHMDFKPVESQTQPPKSYTLETLNNYLKSPFKKESGYSDDEIYKDILDGLEIGTEATRTGIIENAIKNNYISLKNNVYSIEPLGIYMIQLLEKLQVDISTLTTVNIGKLLKKVYRNECPIDVVVKEVDNTIRKSFKGKDITVNKVEINEKKVIGTCPKCGTDVIGNSKGFFCKENNCKFALFPVMKYFSNEIKITDAKAKALLGKSNKASFSLTNKEGKNYTAYLRIKLSDNYVNFEFVSFVKKKKGK